MYKYSCYTENTKEAREWAIELGYVTEKDVYKKSEPYLICHTSCRGKAVYWSLTKEEKQKVRNIINHSNYSLKIVQIKLGSPKF